MTGLHYNVGVLHGSFGPVRASGASMVQGLFLKGYLDVTTQIWIVRI